MMVHAKPGEEMRMIFFQSDYFSLTKQFMNINFSITFHFALAIAHLLLIEWNILLTKLSEMFDEP